MRVWDALVIYRDRRAGDDGGASNSKDQRERKQWQTWELIAKCID